MKGFWRAGLGLVGELVLRQVLHPGNGQRSMVKNQYDVNEYQFKYTVRIMLQ